MARELGRPAVRLPALEERAVPAAVHPDLNARRDASVTRP
jgi:hypothetical protein